MTALLAMAVGADTPNAVKLIGAFISFAGVALVIAAGQGLDLGASLVGDVLTLVAAACWAVYTVFGAPDPAPPLPAGDHDLGDPRRDGLHGAARDRPAGDLGDLRGLPELGLPIVLALLYSGTLAAGFANVIVFHGVKLLGPTRVTALQFLVPALAVAMAAIFLGEAIRPVQVVGGVVILAGVALLRRGSWPSGRSAARAIGGLAR